MARTLIEIDEHLLDRAAKILGTTTKRATVEAALRSVTGRTALTELAEVIAADGLTPSERDQLREEAWRR